MVNLGFGFGSESPTVKSHFWSSQGLTIAPTTKYTYSQQVYRIRIMYVDVVLRTHTTCLSQTFCFHGAPIIFVYHGMIGIRRNTWLTHCLLLLSLSISLIPPPPVCFFFVGERRQNLPFSIFWSSKWGENTMLEEGGMKKKRGVIKET